MTYTYDPKVLENYNNANYTDIEAVPAWAVKFSNGGTVIIVKEGELKSTPLTIDISLPAAGCSPMWYMQFLVSFTSSTAAMAANGENSDAALCARYIPGFPGADKTYNGQPASETDGCV